MQDIAYPFAIWCDIVTAAGACAILYSILKATRWGRRIKLRIRRA